MHRPARLVVVLATLLVLASVGTAQTAPLDVPLIPPPERISPAPETAVLPAGTWNVDLLVGLPTGLRLQRSLGSENDSPWVGELFVGAEAILLTGGVGVRRRYVPLAGRRDCLRISPGIDAYLLYWPGADGGIFQSHPGAAGFVAADVDFVWEHVWGECFGTELGLKLGVGGAFSKYDSIVLPVVSVFAGFRF